jgi:hypothetical protein
MIEISRYPSFVGPLGKPLRVVILECPYDVMGHKEVQSLFPKILALKIQGYRSAYPYGVMPVDMGDFVGTHVVLCEEREEGLVPLMGFKSVNLDRCETFRLQFPAFGLLDGTQLSEHKKAVLEYINRAKSKGESVGYNGSWTMSPEVRVDRKLAQTIKDMSISFLALYYQTYNIKNVVAAAVVRFKVNELKKFIGFSPIQLGSKSLETFSSPAFFGEELALMTVEKFSDEINALAKTFETLWNQRLILSQETLASQSEKAAA